MKKIFVIIPVHNRCSITVRCLENLRENDVFKWASIVVIDDGSTDGTSEKLSELFPDVHLLKGDGSLYWTGAIEKGMRYVIGQGCDMIFWLNDDCLPENGSLEKLFLHTIKNRTISIAQSVTPSGHIYGGYRKTIFGLKQIKCRKNERLACDTFNGNCVCIPSSVIKLIGYPNAKYFPHHYGDSDYGLRASKAGVKCYIVGDAICKNEDNLEKCTSWTLSKVKLRDIWKRFSTVISPFNFSAAWKYRTRHWTAIGMILFAFPYLKFFLICLIRFIIPRSLLIKIYGENSKSWRREEFYQRKTLRQSRDF